MKINNTLFRISSSTLNLESGKKSEPKREFVNCFFSTISCHYVAKPKQKSPVASKSDYIKYRIMLKHKQRTMRKPADIWIAIWFIKKLMYCLYVCYYYIVSELLANIIFIVVCFILFFDVTFADKYFIPWKSEVNLKSVFSQSTNTTV